MDAIAAVMFEPVGCLAEFRAEEFDAASSELCSASGAASATGSQAYWRLLELLNPSYGTLDAPACTRLEELELAAVERAELYEDVGGALDKLRTAGVKFQLVSSLSQRALARFTERFSLGDMFAGVTGREDASGVLHKPLRHAVAQTALDPVRVIYLVDTQIALDVAKRERVNALLMINDYDDARALAERSPAGGVVSLAELPDALMLIEQRAGLRGSARMLHKPFELFEPG